MKNKNLGLFFILVFFLGGCAFAKYQAPINYQYSPPDNQKKLMSLITTNVGAFTDSRHINDPKMIINFVNDYGQTTTGGYLAEKPVAEVIQDALIQGLQSKGIKLDETSSKIIEGELLDTDTESITGFWSGKLIIKFTVKIFVKDAKSSKVLWRDTYIARGETKCTLGGIPVIQKAFTSALDDFTSQIVSDDLFLSQLQQNF